MLSSAPNVTAPMMSQMVSSMLSMPPRESNRSMSAMPEFIEKPFAIVFQTAWIEPTTAFGLPSISRTNCSTTSRCVMVACAPANSAAAINANEAGTLRIDRNASNASGSDYRVIQKISDSLANSTSSLTRSFAGGPAIPRMANPMHAMTNAGTLVQAWLRIWV